MIAFAIYFPPQRQGRCRKATEGWINRSPLYFHRHLARLAIEAQEESAPVGTTKVQRSSDGLGIALEALPQLIAYAIAAGHQGRKTWQTLPLTPPQGRGVYTTDLCPHQQNIILPPLAGGMGRGPLGPLEALPPLMTCRYCIRYQLGQCLKRNPHAVRGPLYLLGADGRRFLLRFDCKACQMTVEIER